MYEPTSRGCIFSVSTHYGILINTPLIHELDTYHTAVRDTSDHVRGTWFGWH